MTLTKVNNVKSTPSLGYIRFANDVTRVGKTSLNIASLDVTTYAPLCQRRHTRNDSSLGAITNAKASNVRKYLVFWCFHFCKFKANKAKIKNCASWHHLCKSKQRKKKHIILCYITFAKANNVKNTSYYVTSTHRTSLHHLFKSQKREKHLVLRYITFVKANNLKANSCFGVS